MFRALDDKTRRLIIDELAIGDGQTLFEICSLLAAKHGIASSRQAISQHLAVLESAGLVVTERRGRSKVPLLRQRTARCDHPAVANRRERHLHENHDYRRLRRRPGGGPRLLHRRARLSRSSTTSRWASTHGQRSCLRLNPDGPELLLEPAEHPAVKPYRDALVEDGIPLAQFGVDDVQAEYERLTERGVTFTPGTHPVRGTWSSPCSTTPAATSS